MSLDFKRALLLACSALLLFSRLLPAGEEVDPIVPEFWFPEPTEALVLAAQKAGIPLEGFEFDGSREGLVRGDTVVALVEWVSGSRSRQWLVVLVGSEWTRTDREMPQPPEDRFFTSTGNEIVLEGEGASLAIRVIGPVDLSRGSRKDPKDVWSETLVNGASLRRGFVRGCATYLRLKAVAEALEVPEFASFEFSARNTPLSEEEIVHGRKMATMVGLSLDDEEAFVAMIPTMSAFFGIASRTPGPSEILMSVVQIPIWSILIRGGKMPESSFWHLPITASINATEWGLESTTEAYQFGNLIFLNERPALVYRAAVVPPQPPLVASAGIVGLVAGRPDGKGARLMIQVIASRPASVSPTDAVPAE